jgi:uncharacterized membrane protein YraQ (UPF0718 family)
VLLALDLGSEVVDALSFSFGMLWEILWALILGFALSGAVQAVVSRGEMRRLLPDDSPRSLVIASGLGAASSSCSYAAVALARSLFRKGADFTASMAFQFASTNLVIELGIIMALLLGWQFTLGEFVGGPLMIVLIAVAFRLFLTKHLVDEAFDRRPGRPRKDGGARWDGDVRPAEGGNGLAAPPLTGWVHRHCELLRDGLGGDLDRHPGRTAHRRGTRCLGPRIVVAGDLL